MKTIVELLTILRDNLHRLRSGLCLLIKDLKQLDIISENECYGLLYIIHRNIPSKEDYLLYDGYYFEPGNTELRYNYLSKLIKNYSE